jgi:hypothetical protein
VNSRKIEELLANDPMFGHQVELERLYNKNQLLKRVRREFENASGQGVDLYAYMKARGIDPEFGYDLLVQLVLHKRTSLPTMVGILRHHVDEGMPLQPIADMILKCCENDLCDWSPASEQLIVKLDITPDVQEELDKYQFPLPMVVEPRELKSNTSSAYISCRDGSVILRNNHHDDDICLDHLNRVNKIKFTLDNATAGMVHNRWRNLDKAKPGETKADFERRKRAFEKYDRSARIVMSQVTRLGNEFWLTHKYDKRGRVYCQGYHINYQGAPWNKAVVQLADKEIVI